MKAILLVDMPHCMCRQCIFLERMTLNHIVQYWCGAERLTIENPNIIQDFCPLKPLPQKRIPKDNGKGLLKLAEQYCSIGFNACLEEITGEL